MASENSKISYFNTLIFTIVSGIISLILIVLLFFNVGKDLIYLIVTMEIGIFSVVGICLYQIIKNETDIKNMKKNLPERVSFNECPDYFIKSDEKGTIVCKNSFKSRDGDNNEYNTRIYPADIELPNPLPENSLQKYEKFNLFHIEQSNKLLKAGRDQCAVINSTPPNVELAEFRDYSKIPWTHARSRCGPYTD